MGWAPTPPLDVGRWLNRREERLFRTQSKADRALEPATLAAWTMLTNELMNLDEVLNK